MKNHKFWIIIHFDTRQYHWDKIKLQINIQMNSWQKKTNTKCICAIGKMSQETSGKMKNQHQNNNQFCFSILFFNFQIFHSFNCSLNQFCSKMHTRSSSMVVKFGHKHNSNIAINLLNRFQISVKFKQSNSNDQNCKIFVQFLNPNQNN